MGSDSPGVVWQRHKVTITKPFYIGKYEVTQAQWETLVSRDRSMFRGRPNNPVEKVSWMECEKFIKRLNALGQGTFRLPTEAEWEYACRAGTNTEFSFSGQGGDFVNIANEYMWWQGNNDENITKEVGLKKPNHWGIYDMHGNVREWCSDIWEDSYQRGEQTDPPLPVWHLSYHRNKLLSITFSAGFPSVYKLFPHIHNHQFQSHLFRWCVGKFSKWRTQITIFTAFL